MTTQQKQHEEVIVGACTYRYPDHRLKASEIEALFEKLMEPFSDQELQQASKAETKKGYDTKGIIAQCVIDRVNKVIGLTHYKEIPLEISKGTKKTSSSTMLEVTYKMTIQVGNYITIFTPDGDVRTGFEVLAERTGYNTHASFNEGDAIKSAITGARKKAWAGFSVGGQVYKEGRLKPPHNGNDNDRQYRSNNKSYNKGQQSNQRKPPGPAQPPNQEKRQQAPNGQDTQDQQNQRNQQGTQPNNAGNATQMVNSRAIIQDDIKAYKNQDKIIFRFRAGFQKFGGQVYPVQSTPMAEEQAAKVKQLLYQYKGQEILIKGRLQGEVVIMTSLTPPNQTNKRETG